MRRSHSVGERRTGIARFIRRGKRLPRLQRRGPIEDSFRALATKTRSGRQAALRADFRLRALVAAVALGGVAWAVYLLARSEAPQVFQGLSDSRWGRPVRYGTGAFAVVTLAALSLRWFSLARVTAKIQVALILWGCALAQYPLLVPPDIAIGDSAAPPVVQTLLLIALGAGSLILLPSIYYLFRVFKGHTFQLSRVSTDDPR
jgi:cytochrome bd ubiquinol oxidase subunit II